MENFIENGPFICNCEKTPRFSISILEIIEKREKNPLRNKLAQVEKIWQMKNVFIKLNQYEH